MFAPDCEKTMLLTLVGNGAVAEKLLAFIVNPVFGVNNKATDGLSNVQSTPVVSSKLTMVAEKLLIFIDAILMVL